jgi:hypothetical protein
MPLNQSREAEKETVLNRENDVSIYLKHVYLSPNGMVRGFFMEKGRSAAKMNQ